MRYTCPCPSLSNSRRALCCSLSFRTFRLAPVLAPPRLAPQAFSLALQPGRIVVSLGPNMYGILRDRCPTLSHCWGKELKRSSPPSWTSVYIRSSWSRYVVDSDAIVKNKGDIQWCVQMPPTHQSLGDANARRKQMSIVFLSRPY